MRIAALEDALAEEIRLERELVAVALCRRESLVALDAVAVDDAGSRERDLLAALSGAAERRLRRTVEVARDFAVPEAATTVARIAAAAGEPARTRLLALVAEHREALRELSRINGANRALTVQALDHVEGYFRILGDSRGPGVYSRRGLQPRQEAPRVMFDAVI